MSEVGQDWIVRVFAVFAILKASEMSAPSDAKDAIRIKGDVITVQEK